MNRFLQRLFFTGRRAPAPSEVPRQPEEGPERLLTAGHSLEDRGEFEAALACYQRAIDAEPESPRPHMNAGNALRRLERWDEAIAAQRAAVQCAPEYAPARFNLGLLLNNRDERGAAEVELSKALQLQPDMKEAALVLADIYEAGEQFDRAEAQFERALAIDPEYPGALLNFGMFCFRRGRFDEAMAMFRQAKALEPGFKDVESSILFSLNFRTGLDADTIADEHRKLGLAITAAAGPPFASWSNTPDPGRALRVGYVSGDFLQHPVALFLRPVLERHDRGRFETFCYSNYSAANPIAQSLRDRTRHWRSIAELGDDDVIDQIRRDEIDILVDLSGHTARHRLSIFARHPAPVQVTWLGYLNTTGLPLMDYRLCDWHTDPEGETERLHTECLVRLPYSQWCYEPWSRPDLAQARHDAVPDSITFGSFNQYRKISDECLGAWCEILHRLPTARLLVMDVPQSTMRTAFIERVRGFGIDPARVSVRGREIILQYFNTIRSVDIALDTFPYNGATTTFDTLLMGLPLVALRGDRGISRGSYSILKSLSADDLIANSLDEYVNINLRLATDHEWRNELRASLGPRMETSPLMDSSTFVLDLEARYREMWLKWCSKRSRPE